jgi:signal transduction histidine kinase
MLRNSLLRLLIVLLVSSPLNAFPIEKNRNIVVFFSLNSNLPAYKNFIDGLRSKLLHDTHESRNLIIEFLDIERIDKEQYARHIVDIYNNKLKSLNIDLLITFGPGLNEVLVKYGLEALNTVPVVDVDLDMAGRFVPEEYINKNRAEILLKFNPEKTFETAFRLFPDFKNVYVVSGGSDLDKFFTTIMHQGEKNFSSHTFINIAGITMDSTLHLMKVIPAESIVIVPNYFADSHNVPFTISEVISFLSANCKAPVLPVTDSFIEMEGGIGGCLFSFTSVGKEAGRIAGLMLNGKNAKDIAINNNFYQYIFDWKELKKRNLLRSPAIPAGSTFVNESFFSRHKYYSIAVMIFLILQSFLIIYLIRLNRRQKKISKAMHETEVMHKELIITDRMAKMTELTGSLSHELNQPLAAILYSAQAGKRFLQKDMLDNSQATEIFDNIIEDDKRAGKIISSVKNLMKPDHKEHEKIELGSLIQETKDLIQAEAIRKNFKMDFKGLPVPVYVMGDKIQLQQVLMNLIRNSFNAMEENDTKLKKLEIIMDLNKEEVEVSVKDSGPGIEPKVRERLFKPFVTTRKDGSGIGLALSRSIIERHKGQIWGENIEGGGAVFSFRLKIVKDDNEKRHSLYHR